jgi:hypothetical protein
MSKTFVNWASRVTIAARVAERRRPQISNELATPGDYHLPFGKGREVALAGLHHLIEKWDRPPV